jgi:hypothetical protein
MKKLAQVVCFSLSLTLFMSPTFAAVKAGSACSKVGSKSVSGGKSYTCVKSGKKLVWDKGQKIVAGVSRIYPDGSGNPNPPIYPETSASKYIQKLIDRTSLTKSTNKTKVSFIVEPTTSNNGPYVKIAQDGTITALKFYSALGLNIPLENLTVVLGRSQEWSRKTILQYLPDRDLGTDPLQGGFTLGGKLIYTNLVNGTIHTENPADDSDLSRVIESSDWAADFAHETFHVFQASSPTKLYETFPIWMSEGSAQLFGYMTASKMSNGKTSYNQEVQKYIDWQHDTQANCSGPIEEMQPPCNYTQGLFVTEFLVSKYGLDGLVKLLHKSSGSTFADQFFNATGEKLDDFYALANQALKLRGWRNNVLPNPNSQVAAQRGPGTPNPYTAADLTAPSNLKYSEDLSSLLFKWDPPSKGQFAIEFYRIHGDCTQLGISCGSFEKDIWPAIQGEDPDPYFQISKSQLGDFSGTRVWKFEIFSGNQIPLGVVAPSGLPVTINLKGNL